MVWRKQETCWQHCWDLEHLNQSNGKPGQYWADPDTVMKKSGRKVTQGPPVLLKRKQQMAVSYEMCPVSSWLKSVKDATKENITEVSREEIDKF